MHPPLKITILVLCLNAASLSAQRVVRGPYLQRPAADAITIRWRTDAPTDSRVQYYAASDSTKQFNKDSNAPTTEHEVVLTELPRDARYFYKIGTTQKVLSQSRDQHFTTAPAADTERAVRFWAMGDFGALDNVNYLSNQRQVRDQFLAKKNGPVDLWVWLGDNAYCCGTESEYQAQVFDFYGSAIFGNMPILPSPGNHEYYATPSARERRDRKVPYYDIVTTPAQGESGGVPSGTEAYYAANYGNVHFVSLDSYGHDEGKYPLSDKNSPQYKWLDKDLADNTLPWTVVFFHHPPYTKRAHDSDGEADLRVLREALVPLFDRHKVDLVLNGHSHVYERSYLMKNQTGLSFTFDKKQHVVQDTKAFYTKDSAPIINKDEGTIYMTIGSAGRLDWNGRNEPLPASVYSNVEIGGSSVFTVQENRLDAQWICADGQIRDQFTVFKNVGKSTQKRIVLGQSVELTASWPGTYRWSTGQVNARSVTVQPQGDMLVTVRDSLGYLADSFRVFVEIPPILAVAPTAGELIIYPNPGNDRVVIENPARQNAEVTVTITDLDGKNRLEKPFLFHTKQEIDIRSLPAGVYVIEVKSATQSWRKRIVKY